MSSFSDYLENKVLDHVYRNVAYTAPTGTYLALYTVAPTDAGGGTEVTGGGYARQAITFGASSGGQSPTRARWRSRHRAQPMALSWRSAFSTRPHWATYWHGMQSRLPLSVTAIR